MLISFAWEEIDEDTVTVSIQHVNNALFADSIYVRNAGAQKP